MGERLREVLLYSDEQPDPRFWCNTYEIVIGKRGKRRHHVERCKRNAKQFMLKVWKMEENDIDGNRIGTMETTHCRPCSCHLCRSEEGLKHSDRKRIMRSEEE